MRMRRPHHRLLLALSTALLLAACGDDGAGMVTEGRVTADRAAAPARELAAVEMARGIAAPGEESAVRARPESATRQLIRRGHMSLRVEQVEPAVDRLRAVATELGGYVGDVSIHTGDEQVRNATVHLRIPAARFDDAVAAIRPVGTVESVNVSAEDVTEQMLDIEARLSNARRLEERLLTLLETRTGDLQQVLAAERELSRVRTEIERFDAQLRRLEMDVSMSTLTVHVREPRAVLGGAAGPSVLGEAFRQAGRNFVATVAGIITIAGALLPVLVLLAALAVPAALWLRRRHARRRAHAGPSITSVR